jgi:hypothetical protein
MTSSNYHLGDAILKAPEDAKLWQTEKGIVEIGKNTLAIPVISHDHVKGYIFIGHSKLLLDTIVETKEGAVDKSVEKETHELFIMLGNAELIGRKLKLASSEDLSEAAHADRQELMAKAEEILERFPKNGGIHSCQCLYDNNGRLFAFQNEAGNLDILLAKDSKIVYKDMDTVFISNKEKAVLKSRDVVYIGGGKSVVVKQAKCSPVLCC